MDYDRDRYINDMAAWDRYDQGPEPKREYPDEEENRDMERYYEERGECDSRRS